MGDSLGLLGEDCETDPGSRSKASWRRDRRKNNHYDKHEVVPEYVQSTSGTAASSETDAMLQNIMLKLSDVTNAVAGLEEKLHWQIKRS